MSVLVVGLSHKTAPVELREHLSLPQYRLKQTLSQLRELKSIEEAVVLSTCNRFEIYARANAGTSTAFSVLKKYLKNVYDHPKLDSTLYKHSSIEAIRHLFRVSSGLDSLVVGESEILGQVKNSYLTAQNLGATGKIINVLFQRALFVGKQVRSETELSEGASSVGSIAAQLAQKIFGNLIGHRVLVLGAGEMAEVTARHLMSQKATDIIVLNRTIKKAETLAQSLHGEAGSLESLEKELIHADIVIGSTSAEKHLVTKQMVENVMEKRQQRSLYFVDIAVPRNIDPEAHDVDNVYVYNVDDLEGLVNENLEKRKGAIRQAESIVDDLAREISSWVSATLKGERVALRHKKIK